MLVSLKVGDVGTVSSSQFVNFGETDIPIASAASFRPGDSVRIEAFDEAGPILTVSNVVAKRSCPKCGHAF